MDSKDQFAPRPHDPFDDSAVERQRRMGLLTEQGGVDHRALSAFCSIHAGLFFDDLLDYCTDAKMARAICRQLLELSVQEDARRVLLALSMQYDAMNHTLPDPVWWIVGSSVLLPPFIEGFMHQLAELANELSEVV